MSTGNINTENYWNSRFASGNWGNSGRRQTEEYAKANIQELSLDKDFAGTIVDFGCALGDSIPVYASSFPNARLIGMDISPAAIDTCSRRFGSIADFRSGDHNAVPQTDIIIASHIMEHITDDRRVVESLLSKCKMLYIFVPYRETPLFFEHVNYYDENYYIDFDVQRSSVFTVSYRRRLEIRVLMKNLINLRFSLGNSVSKEIILFEIIGHQ